MPLILIRDKTCQLTIDETLETRTLKANHFSSWKEQEPYLDFGYNEQMGTHLSYYVTCWKCWHWLLSDFFFISLLQNRLSRMAFGRTLINLIMLFQFIASLMKYAYIYSIPKVGVVVLRRSYKSFLKMYMYGCGTLFTSSFIWYLHTSRFLSNTADVAISWVLIRQKARHFPGLPDVHKQKVSWWWNSTLLCCIKVPL